jgi:hypothetical protein
MNDKDDAIGPILVITHKCAKPRERGLLDEGAPEILRCAQNDRRGSCHSERSEESLVDLWVITSHLCIDTFHQLCICWLTVSQFYKVFYLREEGIDGCANPLIL